MGYKNKTNFYRIPVMGAGDVMTEQQNWKQMSIVDNLLYASTFGCSQCFLQQGDYTIDLNTDGYFCYLLISPYNPGGFSLMGILNYRMFYSKDVKKVGPLYDDLRYYIYVEYDEIMEINPEGFSINCYTSRQEPNDSRMLLCVVQTGRNPKLNTDVNKIYSKNILSHTKDNTNPHGSDLYQENLVVNNSLSVNDLPLYGSFYMQYKTNDKNIFVWEIPFNMEVVFVSAFPESCDAGFISWKIVNDCVVFTNSIQKEDVIVNVKFDLRKKQNDI